MIKILCDQHSEAWFQARLGRVTGTRFAQLMMGDSTKGYKDLILDIAGEILTGEAEETYTNEIMQRGIDLEPEARKEYESLFECKVEQVGFIIPDEENKYHDWIGISPDGLTDGLQEFKCPMKKTHLSYINVGKLPNDYKYQVQGQLFTTELPYCDFMSYYPGLKPFIVREFPDVELFKEFETRLDQTIELVKIQINKYNQYSYL